MFCTFEVLYVHKCTFYLYQGREGEKWLLLRERERNIMTDIVCSIAQCIKIVLKRLSISSFLLMFVTWL